MNHRIFLIIMLAGVLTAGVLRNQPVHDAYTDVSAQAGGAADTTDTDKQTEFKMTVKREGKKLTLQKTAEAEVVRLIEEELEKAFPCNGMMPLSELAKYAKNGIVIEVSYPKGKELMVQGDYPFPASQEMVNNIRVMTAEGYGSFLNYNDEIGARKLTRRFCEGLLKYLTGKYIISEEPIDYTAPKTNIKNGKTYKTGKKITFSDKGSGMKYAKLDGKKIKSGHTVHKKGKHKLVLADKAGNKRTVKFTIR